MKLSISILMIILLQMPAISFGQTTSRVKTAPVIKKSMTLKSTQPAQLCPDEEAVIISKLSGYIKKVHVDIGDEVKKDQELITLDIPELRDELEQKLSNVKQAEANIKQAEALYVASKANLEAAKARVMQAEAAVSKAESDFKRWKSESARVDELVKRGAVSQQLADETVQKLNASMATMEEVKAMIQTAQSDVGIAEAKIISAQSEIKVMVANFDAAQTMVKKAQTMLEYTVIKAPFSGVISSRNIDTGSYVDEKSNPLLKLMKIDKLRVRIEVPENEATWVNTKTPDGKPADKVEITIKSMNKNISGEVSRISWAINESTRTMRTEADVDNQQNELRPGLYAIAVITLEERKDVLTIPASAVFKDGNKLYCSTVKNNQVTRKEVTTGLRIDPDLEIKSGLEMEDQVISIRPETFTNGQQVEVIP